MVLSLEVTPKVEKFDLATLRFSTTPNYRDLSDKSAWCARESTSDLGFRRLSVWNAPGDSKRALEIDIREQAQNIPRRQQRDNEIAV